MDGRNTNRALRNGSRAWAAHSTADPNGQVEEGHKLTDSTANENQAKVRYNFAPIGSGTLLKEWSTCISGRNGRVFLSLFWKCSVSLSCKKRVRHLIQRYSWECRQEVGAPVLWGADSEHLRRRGLCGSSCHCSVLRDGAECRAGKTRVVAFRNVLCPACRSWAEATRERVWQYSVLEQIRKRHFEYHLCF